MLKLQLLCFYSHSRRNLHNFRIFFIVQFIVFIKFIAEHLQSFPFTFHNKDETKRNINKIVDHRHTQHYSAHLLTFLHIPEW